MAKTEQAPEVEQMPVPKSSEKRMARLKEQYPDLDWDNDPEAMHSALDQDEAGQTEKLSKYEASQAKLNDVLMKDPRFARALNDAANGGNGGLSMVRNFGKDALAMADDEEFADEFIKAQQEFTDNMAKNGQIEEEQRANLEDSMATLEEIATENNMSEEEFTQFLDDILQFCDDGMMGRLNKTLCQLVYLGKHHPEDVEAAYKMGLADAANKKIRTESKESLGDNIPSINSGAGNDKPKDAPAYQKRDVFAQWQSTQK